MSATPPPPSMEVQGNPREMEGVSQVIFEGVAMSVPLILKKHLPFSEGGKCVGTLIFFSLGVKFIIIPQ